MRTLITIIAILLLAGCDRTEYWHSEIENPKSAEEIIQWELENGARVDTFFLDYYFGMSRSEYHATTERLISEGRLKKGRNSIPTYVFKTDNENIDFVIAPDAFLNDSLQSLDLIGKPRMASLVTIEIPYIYKYGPPNISKDGEYFQIIKGNMAIKASQSKTYGGILINYSDHSKEDQAFQEWLDRMAREEEKEEQENIERRKSVIEDI